MEKDFDDILARFNNPTPLSSGGQKAVYRTSLAEYGEVVLKIGAYESLVKLERIQREFNVLRNIDSPYYPKIFSFENVGNNRFLIIEEYIPSKTLAAHFHKFRTPRSALNLVRELVTGLSILWEQRIVHRDLKPENILITDRERVKIIDLGSARVLDLESLTETYVGAPISRRYAAPEQQLNQKDKIDHRTDQFALGIILYQLLLGSEHPFSPMLVGSGETIPDNIINNNWDRSSLDQSFMQPVKPIITKLLGHEPYERFRTASMLIQAIDTALGVL